MKLLNYSTTYFALPLLVILSVWAGIFYFAMLDEIYDSLGDVLEHQKTVVIQKAATDSTVLNRTEFDDGYYIINETTPARALNFKDRYLDTLMYLEVEEDYEPIRMLITMFQQNGKYYELKVITSMVEEDDLIDELLYSLIWLYAGLLATILLLNNFLLKRIWRPFYLLLGKVRDFRLDAPEPLQMPDTKVDEFRMLNETVEKLLQNNVSTFNRQKQFIENASHEMQTPLAISRNKLELMAESNNLTDEQAQLLGSSLTSLDRLARLNKSLLLLTRIENRQFTDQQPVDVRQLIDQIISDISLQADHKEVKISVQQTENCTLSINPDLATILFLNLINNALIHNQKGGFIAVSINSGAVTVQNSGKPEALNPDMIFSRFYKGNTSGTSTGLGLAISKAIADMYGYLLSYRFENSAHIFEVNFR